MDEGNITEILSNFEAMGNSISDRIVVNVVPYLNGLVFNLLHFINASVSNNHITHPHFFLVFVIVLISLLPIF